MQTLFSPAQADGSFRHPTALQGKRISDTGWQLDISERETGRAFPRAWTPDADSLSWLAERGWHPYIATSEPVIEWWQEAVHTYAFDGNGSVTDQWAVIERPVPKLIEDLVEAVEQTHHDILNDGFTYDFGTKTATLPDGTTEPAGVRTIQTRSQDRERWQATMQVAQQYIMAGAPTEPMRPFRTEDNASIPMTAQGVADCLNAMQAFFGKALDALWAHKDAIRALTTVDDVVAYDITTLWP